MAKKPKSYKPDGMHTLTTHLWFNGNCKEAIDFYQKALNAKLVAPPVEGPGGNGIMHVMLKIGDSNIMMADVWPNTYEKGPGEMATSGMFVYVEDADASFNKAVDAGCDVIYPMENAFWGDRTGKVKDPFGHTWQFATFIEELTPEEIEQRQEEWMKGLQKA